MDYSLPGSSVQGISQATTLAWVAIPFSRGSSWPRDWIWVFSFAGRFFAVWATREAWWRGGGEQQLKIVYIGHRIKTKLLGDVPNVTELENESFNTVDPWQYRFELQSPLTLIHRLFFNGKHYSTAMAPHSSALAWRIPGAEEPGGLQSMGSLRVGHNWATSLSLLCIGEGNGTPLHYSCLENPIGGGAWKAAVHGVAEGRTRLSDFTFTFHFHALEKELATHSSVLAWRIPGTGEPGGLPSMGSHRVGHDWSDLAAAAAAAVGWIFEWIQRAA